MHYIILRLLVLFFISLFFASLYAQESEQYYLSLSESEFNSYGCCWRSLVEKKDFAGAADLIGKFITTNKKRLKNPKGLYFHYGQMLACLNDPDAIDQMKKSKIFLPINKDDKAWNYYVEGTIAFLVEDEICVPLNRLRLEKLGYQNEANHQVLVLLEKNMGQSYKDLLFR